MFGLGSLQQSVKDGFDAVSAQLIGHDNTLREMRDVAERLHTLNRASAIDTNRRLATIEANTARLQGATEALGAYEESHASYRMLSVNGFEQRERTDCACALCLSARKYL